jgi:hypothetical protein
VARERWLRIAMAASITAIGLFFIVSATNIIGT